MVYHTMDESDDSRPSSGSNSSESCSNSPIKETSNANSGHGISVNSQNMDRSVRAGSTSSSSSNSSSSSSRSGISKGLTKKSSSSSSGSGSGSSSGSSSSSEDEGDSTRPPPPAEIAASIAAASALTSAEGQAEAVLKSQSPSSGHSRSRSRSRSRSISPQLYNQAAVDLNISHEDLSDVSDIEADEKRAPSKNSLNLDEDEDEDGAISDDSLPAQVNGKAKTSSEDDTQTSHKLEEPPSSNGRAVVDAKVLEDLVKTHDDDDALDFEAEEGECPELSNKVVGVDVDGEAEETPDETNKAKLNDNEDGEAEKDEEAKEVEAAANKKKQHDEEELEEGEVSDEDEKRPEETEPKPVCRFYTRGQCTWGMSCRFLHPGVTDKGNYTMFESLVRSVPMQGGGAGGGSSVGAGVSGAGVGGGLTSGSRVPSGVYSSHAAATDYHDYRNERPPLHHRSSAIVHHGPSIYGGGHHESSRPVLLPSEVPVVVENAWERGLRTAKEMMRKANKRKEQDMDFEDKKMNLTLSPDELEKDPYYLKERGGGVASPPPPNAYSVFGPPLPERYGSRGQYMPPPYEDVDAYGRMARYRELPPHRMPHYEDDRRLRPAREVIVQRVEAVGRGDEWSDPWMRSKSMGRGSYEREERRRRDRRSYSSNSSYSTSNSSQSESSSDSSRSSSPSDHKRRYGGSASHHKMMSASSSTRRHHPGRTGARSPSQIPRRPRNSSKTSLSPSYKRPALEKRGAGGHSPASKRKKLTSPPVPKKFDKLRRRRSSSTSDSDSSDTSYSDSDSGSSSSDSSSRSRETPQKQRVRATDKALNERKLIKKPAEQPTKKRSPISIEIKKTSNMVGVSALASPTNSADSDKEKDHSNSNKDKDKEKEKDGKKSRREELLKQLRAVEDAIAKKRSKLS
ncbi:zinc finger CCCH domain-containing protein 18 [Drosophila willistoni]|uniref:zinc finger CCCH domain-containing protein 18 n=1 Tax=Drosophila willistoni TaxID=7260 RepID=UPI000C26C277|nr:zinc finger CCCH domain-containing protein 18 [Drosophila willistoni]